MEGSRKAPLLSPRIILPKRNPGDAFGFDAEEYNEPMRSIPSELYCTKCRKPTPIQLMKSNSEGLYYCNVCEPERKSK